MEEEMEVKMIIELPFELGQTIYQIVQGKVIALDKIKEIRIRKNGYWEIRTNKGFVIIEQLVGNFYFLKRKDAVEFLKERKDAVEYLRERMMEKDGSRKL